MDYDSFYQNLKKARDCGILSQEDYTRKLADTQMKERNELLDDHPSKPYMGKDGKWYCYIREGDKRKKIKRNTEEEVKNEVAKRLKVAQETVTIKDLFEEYISRKIQNDGLKQSTICRYRNVFNRHYHATNWDKKNIKHISAEDWSDWIESEIGRCDLDAKALSNLRGITGGIIKRAIKKRMIDYSASLVFELVDARPHKKYKDDSKEVLSQDEFVAFINYVKDNQSVVTLSLLLMLITGLRVGEMVALKFTDFISDTSFKVHATETYYQNDDGKWIYEVSHTPKTHAGNRTVIIPSGCEWIIDRLRKLNPEGKYICTHSKTGERMHAQVLKQKMYQICRALPTFKEAKSSHKLRKTYCSILLDNGIDKNLIIKLVGHIDDSTTEKCYHRDRKTDEQKQKILDNVVEFRLAAGQ